jgi:hypothetical protein
MRGTRANVAPAPAGKSKRACPFDEPTPAATKRPPLDTPRNAGADAEVRRDQRGGQAVASLPPKRSSGRWPEKKRRERHRLLPLERELRAAPMTRAAFFFGERLSSYSGAALNPLLITRNPISNSP